MNSSDWWAKEKEWRDSDGNRLRSSVKFNVGDEGPEAIAIDAAREAGKERVIEPDRAPTEGLRDDASEEGRVGARTGGCCRMRLSPDAPKPCSCSVMTGVLRGRWVSYLVSYMLCSHKHHKHVEHMTRVCSLSTKLLQLRTNLDIVSKSAADDPASKENRMRAFSVFGACACARRFPVLRFLGIRKSGPGYSLRPRSLFSGSISTSAAVTRISRGHSGGSLGRRGVFD